MADKIYQPTIQPSKKTASTSPNNGSPYMQQNSKSKQTYGGYQAQVSGILVDKDQLQQLVCENIMLGLHQVKEGLQAIKKQKGEINDDVWKSDSVDSYKTYLDDYQSYINEVSGFFEVLSKKVINDAEVFEALDRKINEVIASGSDISGWR